MTNECHFAGVTIDLPLGWVDVTDDLPADSPPTLSRGEHGVGVLQFSVGKYTRGKRPRMDRHDLQVFLREFEQTHDFNPADTLEEFQNRDTGTFGVFADYRASDKFTRIWYVSNGEHAALISFVANQPQDSVPRIELREAREIVLSVVL